MLVLQTALVEATLLCLWEFESRGPDKLFAVGRQEKATAAAQQPVAVQHHLRRRGRICEEMSSVWVERG